MMLSPQRIATRYLQARTLNLSDWGLEGLTSGKPVTLYHGTNRSFSHFDLNKNRTDLVNDYYGGGIFLTPSKRVADEYANANRNVGFEPSLIDDLKSKNPKAASFMKQLYTLGQDAWDLWTRESLNLKPEDDYSEALAELAGGLDPNTLADLCMWTLGSKLTQYKSEEPINIFSQSSGMPYWVYDMIDEVGLDSKKYRPKIYTVSVKVNNTLVTASKSQAKAARRNGYDCVVFYGADLVDGVPEVAVFDPHKVKIMHVELS